MRLDKMILKGRKTEIIASAKEKYRKTMEFIRGAATEAFTAEGKDFCTIVDESENYQRQLDSLNDFIREAQETQREIARKLCISRSYVSRIEKTALQKLRGLFPQMQ